MMRKVGYGWTESHSKQISGFSGVGREMRRLGDADCRSSISGIKTSRTGKDFQLTINYCEATWETETTGGLTEAAG